MSTDKVPAVYIAIGTVQGACSNHTNIGGHCAQLGDLLDMTQQVQVRR